MTLQVGDVCILTDEYKDLFFFWDFRNDTFEIVNITASGFNCRVKVLTKDYPGLPEVPLKALQLVRPRQLVEIEDML